MRNSIIRGRLDDDDEDEKKADDTDFGQEIKIDSILLHSTPVPAAITVDESFYDTSPDTIPSPPRSVRFNGIHDADADAMWTSPIRDDVTEAELRARLEELQMRLTQAQIDLSAEKALRKRKEKNLFKIAQELVKRAADEEAKDLQIRKLAATTVDLDRKMKAAVEAAAAHHQETTGVQEQLRRQADEHAAKEREIRKEMDATLDDLRRQLRDSKLETDRLRAQLAGKCVLELPSAQTHVLTRSRGLTIVTALVMLMGIVLPKSLDSLCAPTMVGVELSEGSDWHAPWWVPNPFKEPVFDGMCGTRTRTRLTIAGGKLSASNAADDRLLWSRRASGATVYTNQIVIKDKRGMITESVAAPWLNAIN